MTRNEELHFSLFVIRSSLFVLHWYEKPRHAIFGMVYELLTENMKPVRSKDQILLYLRDHRDTLREEYHIKSIGLIGSFSRGEQTPLSDIDLIIEMNPDTQNIFELKNRLRAELECLFGRKVEIVSRKYLKPFYREQILAEAVYV